MKILLACSGGFSTSLLEKSLNNYMKENSIKGTAIAYNPRRAKMVIQDYDIVLLGPQAQEMLESFQKLAGDIPVKIIPPALYALSNGGELFMFAKESLK